MVFAASGLQRFYYKMISRRKKTVILVLTVSAALCVYLRVVHYQQEYSPLQEFSSAEREAQRLLRFLTSYQYQCNMSLPASNSSVWPVCVDQDVGINPNLNVSKIAYSVGPLPDYNFEAALSSNLSIRLLVFLHEPAFQTPQKLLKLNNSIFHTSIVPNDPADFSRNLYDTHTINSIMSKLGHRFIDILKVESVQDMAHSYEVLYFMVKDGIMGRIHQLHIMLEIDKPDENYLYNWYKTLYVLFYSAGFRLYHTSASSPLCLQVTMMESCRYFMSWVTNPGPRTYILYPPAIDGSEDHELLRLKDFLHLPEQSPEDVITVALSVSTKLRLSRQIIMTRSDNCHILVFRFMAGPTVAEEVSALHVRCSVTLLYPVRDRHGVYSFTSFTARNSAANSKTMTFSDIISLFLVAQQQTNILHINLGQFTWMFMSGLLDSGAVEAVDQLVMVAPIAPASLNRNGHQSAHILRHRYSELQRITAFHMKLSEATPLSQNSVKFRSEEDFWELSFVKKE